MIRNEKSKKEVPDENNLKAIINTIAYENNINNLKHIRTYIYIINTAINLATLPKSVFSFQFTRIYFSLSK